MNDGRNLALIVANSDFPLAPDLASLRGPRKDPAVLHHALTHEQTGLFHSDDVCVTAERSAGQVLLDLEDLVNRARSADRVLIYYSGHGLPDKRNRLYLCTHDTRTDRLAATAVSTETMTTILDNGRMRSTVVLLDCCYSGNFKSAATVPKQLTGAGRFVITSSRAGELAQDALAANQASVFTAALAQGLRSDAPDLNGDGYVTLDDIYQYVHTTLTQAGQPTPKRDFSGDGDFAIARRPHRRTITSPATGPAAEGERGNPVGETLRQASGRGEAKDERVERVRALMARRMVEATQMQVELIERTTTDIVLRAIRGANSFTVATRRGKWGKKDVYLNGSKVGTMTEHAPVGDRPTFAFGQDFDTHHLLLDTTHTRRGTLVHARLSYDRVVIFEQEFAADR